MAKSSSDIAASLSRGRAPDKFTSVLIDKRLNLQDRAIQDANKAVPGPQQPGLSDTENTIVEMGSAELSEVRQATIAELRNIIQSESIPRRGDIQRLSNDLRSIDRKVRDSGSEILIKNGPNLRSSYKQMIEARYNYNAFRERHGLNDQLPKINSSVIHWSIIFIIFVAEVVFNTLFIGNHIRGGLIAASTIVIALSLPALLFGMVLGVAFSAMKWRERIPLFSVFRWVFVTIVLILPSLFGGILIALVSARVRYELDAGIAAGQVIEFNVFNIVRLVREDPFLALENLMSSMACLFNLAVFVGTARKAYIARDYPNFASIYSKRERAEKDYEAERQAVDLESRSLIQQVEADIDDIERLGSEKLSAAIAVGHRIHHLADDYAEKRRVTIDACNEATRRYRQINLNIRKDLDGFVPAHFADPVSLKESEDFVDKLDRARKWVEDSNKTLESEFADLRQSANEARLRVDEVIQTMLRDIEKRVNAKEAELQMELKEGWKQQAEISS